MRQPLVPLLEIILPNNHNTKQGCERSKLFSNDTASLLLVFLDLLILPLPGLA
jgi:hypothetical protein